MAPRESQGALAQLGSVLRLNAFLLSLKIHDDFSTREPRFLFAVDPSSSVADPGNGLKRSKFFEKAGRGITAAGTVGSTGPWYRAMSRLLLGHVTFWVIFSCLLGLPCPGAASGKSKTGCGICRVGLEVAFAFFWNADGVEAGHGHHGPKQSPASPTILTPTLPSVGMSLPAHFDAETDKPSLESWLK